MADQLSVNAPATVAAGDPFGVTVTALDQAGNVDTNNHDTVTFSCSDTDPGVVLPASYTFQPSDGGVHTFTDTGKEVTEGSHSLRKHLRRGKLGINWVLEGDKATDFEETRAPAMPRRTRRQQQAPTAYYHVMNCGHNREVVFRAEEGYAYLLDLLKRYREHFALRLYHYCLMSHHFHFLVDFENPSAFSPWIAGLLRSGPENGTFSFVVVHSRSTCVGAASLSTRGKLNMRRDGPA